MNELNQLYATVTSGLAFMSMASDLGGAWVCLAYRRLSNWLIMASAGFAGKCLASAIAQLAYVSAPSDLDFYYFSMLGSNFLALMSMLLLVFGLGLALADLRRKLAISMEPKHVRH